MRKSLLSLMLMMLVVVVAVPTLSTTANGQSALREDQKAVVAFDIRMKKMMDGKFIKEMGGTDAMQMPGGDLDPKKLDRIFGILDLPDDVKTFMDLQGSPEPPEELPMGFYVKMTFVDAESATKMFADIEKESEVVNIGGKKFYKPTEEANVPGNFLAHRPDPTTIEMGTKLYMTQSSKKDLFSPGLASAWGKVPDDNFRVAIDIAGCSKLLKEAVEMGKQGGDAMVAGYLDLIPKMKDLRLSIDMDKENIMTLASSGVDEDGAEEVRGGLDALLGMAKFGGMNAVNSLPDKDVAEVGKKLLNSLKATREKSEVTVAIPKPDGFANAMKKMQELVPMMMMGGPPPGAGGRPPGGGFDR